MKVALLFGSFNPIHVGHLIVAQSVLNNALMDEVWFIVSPLNPFKKKDDLLDESERLKMVQEVIEDNDQMKVLDIEFTLPKPSYTFQTINLLSSLHPNAEFSILIGADNLNNFHLWKQIEEILDKCSLIVYPRLGYELSNSHISATSYTILDVPIMDISSTLIRKMISKNESIRYLVAEKTLKTLEKNKFYSY